MLSVPKHLSSLIQKAAIKAIPQLTEKIQVTPERNKDWDYTCPSAMKIYNASKKTGSYGFATCQDLAQAITENLDPIENDAIEKVELKQAGAGDPSKAGFFMNLTLKNEFVEKEVNRLLQAEKIELHKDEFWKQEHVVVDFSSPNIAKNMHVGHLRSTIIGDTMSRLLEFIGHDVMRINHLGDWGTQFGMLITELNEEFPDFLENPPNIEDLVVFYKKSKGRFDNEEEFKKLSHQNVVKLQQGDERTFKAWQLLCKISEEEFGRIYERLDIKIENKGESFYNPLIKPMLEDLESKGIMKEDKGAKCIFVPKRKIPLMVVKSDGGYNYDTTDLAAVRYRVNEQKATWIIYITDDGQKSHFELVIDGAIIAGYFDPKVTRYDHMGFGLVLQELKVDGKKGEEVKQEVQENKEEEKKEEVKKELPVKQEAKKDGKQPKAPKDKPKVGKIKTREGDSTKLMDLLNEAKARALEIFKERLKDEEEHKEGASGKVQITSDLLDETAEILGISSIKYYDLKQARIQNYVFSFDKMLDPRGNTGVYLLYMYVRIASILRKGNYEGENLENLKKNHKFTITHKSEKELALAILRLPEQIDLTLQELQLNRLTDQLYEVAVKIGEFYQQCKVLGVPEEPSRILLLQATLKVMEVLFHLLGMKTIQRI